MEVHDARYARAARLLGAAAALREQIGTPPDTSMQDSIADYLAGLREALPEEDLATGLAAGREMDWEQAIAYALGEADA